MNWLVRFIGVVGMIGSFGWAMYYHFNSPPMPIVGWWITAIVFSISLVMYVLAEVYDAH